MSAFHRSVPVSRLSATKPQHTSLDSSRLSLEQLSALLTLTPECRSGGEKSSTLEYKWLNFFMLMSSHVFVHPVWEVIYRLFFTGHRYHYRIWIWCVFGLSLNFLVAFSSHFLFFTALSSGHRKNWCPFSSSWAVQASVWKAHYSSVTV